jgi:hypothetical protein
MQYRIADAIARGKAVAENYGTDLFEVDFHALADCPVDDVRRRLSIRPKSAAALAVGSPGLFDLEGMSALQQQYVEEHGGAD